MNLFPIRVLWYHLDMNREHCAGNREWRRFIVIIVSFIAIALIAVIVTVSIVRSMLDRYHGPGPERGFPMSGYDPELFYVDDYFFRNYKDDNTSALRGIDVSSHQRDIDWAEVKKAGVQFAMIRVGFRSYDDGELHADSRFEKNIRGAEENGIRVGAYFFSQAITVDEAIEEAKFVTDRLRGHRVEMPVAYDMEMITEEDRIRDMTMQERTEVADAFCEIVGNHGYDALIYGSPDWIYQNLNLSLLTDHEIWLAHYVDRSEFPYKYRMWQYSATGRVDGIEGDCDLDIYFVERKKKGGKKPSS